MQCRCVVLCGTYHPLRPGSEVLRSATDRIKLHNAPDSSSAIAAQVPAHMVDFIVFTDKISIHRRGADQHIEWPAVHPGHHYQTSYCWRAPAPHTINVYQEHHGVCRHLQAGVSGLVFVERGTGRTIVMLFSISPCYKPSVTLLPTVIRSNRTVRQCTVHTIQCGCFVVRCWTS